MIQYVQLIQCFFAFKFAWLQGQKDMGDGGPGDGLGEDSSVHRILAYSGRTKIWPGGRTVLFTGYWHTLGERLQSRDAEYMHTLGDDNRAEMQDTGIQWEMMTEQRCRMHAYNGRSLPAEMKDTGIHWKKVMSRDAGYRHTLGEGYKQRCRIQAYTGRRL